MVQNIIFRDYEKVIKAKAFTSSSADELHFIEHSLICIDKLGFIAKIYHSNEEDYLPLLSWAKNNNILHELKSDQYLLPGFIDLHVHAPQWPNLGKALDLPLDQWLQEYTFPLEARYSDLEFTRKTYQHLVQTLLENGTTTAVYFATIHRESSVELGRICLSLGQRALIGKVAMDDPNSCPDYYRDKSAKSAIEETHLFIEDIKKLSGNENNQILPVITPRFIPSCTTELLKGLGELAQETHCHVQTHCSESDWEHNYVLERYGVTDAQALNNFGLMTRKTILAHSNLISDDDINIIKSKSAGIAHCPLSNFYFANCVFPLRKALNRHVHVGLGSDIAAGHSPSIFDACRHSITASKALNDGVNSQLSAEQRGCSGSEITFKEAFWLATGGGGEVLDLPIGQLREGYLFDAMVIDTNVTSSDILIREEDSSHDILQKLIYNTQRINITDIWVGGKKVY
ncbi:MULTISPECIES: guanine deaminase [Proteus]|uniref:Guanine deaminase n=1 Tax=Proteus penneri TaxID=102862 RepID=A0ABS0W6F1_9GAMM|nr:MULTISPECIES: guanine deaminase [Proteus]MBJ2117463.1 guanine deaminase [Proteus penneri]MCX2587657.1 guanine deaminase [Proteus penneri]NBL78715.1 guanine deaminase [Proteus sp. G2672]NBM04002.1 guanine deaminase [Proteus sp. G2671]NBM13777.1 guanine deaminase [Proteus sp. G2670]